MIKALIIFLFVFSSQAIAKDTTRFTIGLSNIYTNINDINYSFVNEYEQVGNFSGASLGIYRSFNNFSFGLSTNRLTNVKSERRVVDKSVNNFILKSETTIDSLSLGRLIGRFNPSLFLARTEVEKELFYRNKKVGGDYDIATLYGFSGGYFITRNINAGIILIAPNERLNLEFGSGIFINYLF